MNSQNAGTNAEGSTPLHVMAILGDHQAIAMLMAAGATPDVADACGNTALHEAVLGRQAMAVQALLQAGANPHAINGDGQTPVSLAVSDGHQPVIDLLQVR